MRDVSVDLAEEQLRAVERQAQLQQFIFDRAPEFFEQVAESGALDEQNFTDQLRSAIAAASENALRLGEADIGRQTQLGLENVRDVLAPERGLRPGDSPILGLGSDIVREGQFQQGQLVRGIRGTEAQLLAGLPEFQAQLAQQAFQNRLSLAGTATQLGLGASPTFNVPGALSVLQESRLAQPRTRTKAFSVGSNVSYGTG